MSTFTLMASMKELAKAREPKEIKCEICGKVYKTQKGLDSHIATKHKECDSIDTR